MATLLITWGTRAMRRIDGGRFSRTLSMKSAEKARFSLKVEQGLPYTRDENPTSYVYTVSITTTAGFVPFLDAAASSDSRFLGARVRLVPEYTDAETSIWQTKPGKE